MHKNTFHLLLALLLLGGVSCTTTKRKGDTSKLGKLWHNMNSKYNSHFNEGVLMDETMLAIDQGHQDVYSEILSIYNYIDIDNPQQYAESMDKIVEKAAIAISIHRPSHWTDDHYLMMAKAQFVKQDYESAEGTLRYLIKHYDPDNIVKASESQTRARNSAERRLQLKERAKKNKVAQKEREAKIKERRKQVTKSRKKNSKKSKKARDRERQARIKDRKQQIKDNERLAKQGKSNDKSTTEEAKNDVAGATKKKKKQEPFAENPELPKVKGTAENYFLKHKPIHQEAQLWLAKTLIERDRFGEAATILRNLERDEKTFEEIKEEVYIVQAYSGLRRDLPDAAAGPLASAIEFTSDKTRKARLSFILAQLYEHSNNYAKAGEAYDAVVKLNPSYEMVFNARLNKAIMNWRSGSLAADKFDRELNRMIKDDKNTEYQDQLYFALGQKKQKEGHIDEAIANYSKSARTSVSNKVQKAESYYTIASLQFDREYYIEAKNYFDSTLTVMAKTDERFEDVELYSKSLSGIAANLQEIKLQDSLIELSQLPEKELRKLANKIKKERAKEEAIKNAASAAATSTGRAQLSQLSAQSQLSGKESTFFAYNEKLLKKGQREFDRRWGGVNLADDWRRSDKTSFSDDEVTENEEGGEESISNTEVEEIFADVPKDDKERSEAEAKIEEALFELGRLFRSELANSKKSIESLEELLDRFPDTDKELDAFYMLYIAHTELGNTVGAKKYSQLILDKYPDSDFAAYIKNPSLLQDIQTDAEKLQEFYQGVYAMYEKGEAKAALSELEGARSTFGTKHALQSKFAFLSALCVGRLQGRDPYINALKELIAKYPQTEEEKEAKEIIRLLGVRLAETVDGIEEINPDAYFKLEPNDNLHFAMVPIRSNKGINQGRISIAEYNKKYHNLDGLTIGTIVLDDGVKKVPTYVVRKFATRDKAMAYYDGVQKNIGDFIPDPNGYEVFIASHRNYRKIVQLKSIDLYREFFVREYLSK